MALRDVFETVRDVIQEKYPVDAETRPEGFAHLLGTKALLAEAGTYPRAIWIRPEFGDVVYEPKAILHGTATTAHPYRTFNTRRMRVEIHLWMPDEGDYEEDPAADPPREAGILTEYERAIHNAVQGSYELVRGGWSSDSERLTDGVKYLMEVIFDFPVNDAHPARATITTIKPFTRSVTDSEE